jgi:hypothetical protein
VAGAALGDHGRHERADAVDHAPQVHAQHPLPVAFRSLPDEAAGADAGIVEQQVHFTEGAARAAGKAFDVAADGHVHPFGDQRGARGAQLGGGGVQRILLDVRQHEPHAQLVPQPGEFPAEAAAGAGNDGDLVGEVVQHRCLRGARFRRA